MDEPITYDSDFFAWSQQQASVLRNLAKSHKLPNELDLEHVAEEIEDVGRAELNSVQSYIRQIFVHLIKAASSPGAEPIAHWRKEVIAFHNELRIRFSRSMTQRIDLDTLWSMAIREAEADLAANEEQPLPGLPTDCPFEVQELTAEGFSFRAAVDKLGDMTTAA